MKKLISTLVTWAVILGVIFGIGYLTTDHKDYPGKTEFEAANDKIRSNSDGDSHGNTEKATAVASKFAKSIKSLKAALFTGGSGRSLTAGGDFVTYCRHNTDSAVFMVHVPELRNYKDEKTREAIASLAWTCASQAAAELKFETNAPNLIVGLRGFSSYGPIWSGKLGSGVDTKTDDLSEKKRLYPFFLGQEAAK